MPRKYKPVGFADVTDEALLPKRFDRLSSEVHDLIDEIRTCVMPGITANTIAMQELRSEVGDAITQINVLAGRVDKLEVTDKSLATELRTTEAELAGRVAKLEAGHTRIVKRLAALPRSRKPASNRRARRK